MPKGRESGMPDIDCWESFFDAPCILSRIGCVPSMGTAVEFGCGYGTFTIPTAQIISGQVIALDIDQEMVDRTNCRAKAVGLTNVSAQARDFVQDGTGMLDRSADFVLLFNILHIEHASLILQETGRVLKKGGIAAIIHWRSDIQTPRGPSTAIRPSLHQCQSWAEQAGLSYFSSMEFACCAWHWGLAMTRLQ